MLDRAVRTTHIKHWLGNNKTMKLQTKKTIASIFLRLARPFYKGGLKIRHGGTNHYIMRASKLKLQSLTNNKQNGNIHKSS